MRDSLKALLLLAPLMLTSCDTVQSLGLSDVGARITALWDKPDAPVEPALRQDASDTVQIPDGMQTDDLRMPFGTPAPTVTAANP
jgi:predicted small secreted protein